MRSSGTLPRSIVRCHDVESIPTFCPKVGIGWIGRSTSFRQKIPPSRWMSRSVEGPRNGTTTSISMASEDRDCRTAEEWADRQSEPQQAGELAVGEQSCRPSGVVECNEDYREDTQADQCTLDERRDAPVKSTWWPVCRPQTGRPGQQEAENARQASVDDRKRSGGRFNS